MSQPHVITALVKKHSEIEGEIASLQDQIQSLTKQKSYISQTIKIFDPTYDLRTIKAKQPHTKSPIFEHGECNRLILDCLRKEQPISTDKIVEHILEHKALPVTDQRTVQKAVVKALTNKQKHGIIKLQDNEWVVLA